MYVVFFTIATIVSCLMLARDVQHLLAENVSDFYLKNSEIFYFACRETSSEVKSSFNWNLLIELERYITNLNRLTWMAAFSVVSRRLLHCPR